MTTPAAAPGLVARVAVDVPWPHLDRPFDYAIPAALADAVRPGVRVRVRFAGRRVSGYVLAVETQTAHDGPLSPLDRVVSVEPVLSAEVAGLARAVADHYAGTLADVLRLAVPPRHAGAEGSAPVAPALPPPRPAPGPWARYRAGGAFLEALAAGQPVRAVLATLPGAGGCWPEEVAVAIGTTLAGGRGAVAVLPDVRDVARLDAELTAMLGANRHVVLTADLGPAERYRRFLAARRGQVSAVIGTRSAGYAPVADLGLVVVWDDGDDLHADPHAPYPHAREVAVLRAHRAGAAALVAGFAVTAEGAALVRHGWARPIEAGRAAVRAAAPRVAATIDDRDGDPLARAARLPTPAWRAAHDALAAGHPVLVQVPRAGWAPALACAACRAPGRCPACAGPLAQPTHAVPSCTWCGRPATTWACPACGGTGLRAAVVGAARTAEELGRAFPGTPVRRSGGGDVLAAVPHAPAIVVATPGAEPVADGGYGAVLLLDSWALLSRPDLRAGEEARRRWFAAAALARSAGDGGRVLIAAEAGLRPVQSVIGWRPGQAGDVELDEREALGFPPAVRLAELTGDPAAVADLLALADLPPGSQVLGPVPILAARPHPPGSAVASPAVRAIVRAPRPDGLALSAALRAAAGSRSARRTGDPVRIRVDPVEIG